MALLLSADPLPGTGPPEDTGELEATAVLLLIVWFTICLRAWTHRRRGP